MKEIRYYVLYKSADGLERKERVACRPNISYLHRVALRSLRCATVETSGIDPTESATRRTYYIRDIEYKRHKKYSEAIFVYEEDL